MSAKKRRFKKVIIFFDNVKVHVCKKFRKFLDKNKDFIKVYPLSKYSPNLNGAELIIRGVKKDICSIYCYSGTKELKTNMRKYLKLYASN